MFRSWFVDWFAECLDTLPCFCRFYAMLLLQFDHGLMLLLDALLIWFVITGLMWYCYKFVCCLSWPVLVCVGWMCIGWCRYDLGFAA